MVSNKEIKGLDFDSIEQYYEYLLESVTNGQRTQARKLVEKLSTEQKKDALSYLSEFGQNDNVIDTTNIIIASF